MNLLFFPELFYQVTTNLSDKEKIFLTLYSKITYNFKSLLILDLKYNLEEINDGWCVKNILIKNFSLENKIKELLKDLIPESIVVNSKYVKFVSNNANIKLFLNEEIIEKIVSYGCSYLAMKIMLNNNDSIDNINKQFIIASMCGYLSVVKLLIDLGADIHAQNNEALISASWKGHLYVVKLLIDLGANIHAQNDKAIIYASLNDNLSMVKLFIDLGANIRAQNDKAIIYASGKGNLSVVKLLIESGADIHAENNLALEYAELNKHLSVIELLKKLIINH